MATFKWKVPPSATFVAGVDRYTLRINAAMKVLYDYYAPQIENWMKDNASWTDRTGNARQTLWAESQALVNGAALHFGHGMSYGVFLEYANAGRFAIIAPALDHWTPIIWAAVKEAFGSGARVSTIERTGL